MPEFLMLKNADKIEHDYSEDKVYAMAVISGIT